MTIPQWLQNHDWLQRGKTMVYYTYRLKLPTPITASEDTGMPSSRDGRTQIT